MDAKQETWKVVRHLAEEALTLLVRTNQAPEEQAMLAHIIEEAYANTRGASEEGWN